MKRKVIGAGEGSIAHLALERPVSSVFSVVTSELIRSSEFPSAILPGTLVRFLSSVRPQVGLQVRGFCIGLGAALVIARVSRETFPGTPRTTAPTRTSGGLPRSSRTATWIVLMLRF